jgi:hypothetical protein
VPAYCGRVGDGGPGGTRVRAGTGHQHQDLWIGGCREGLQPADEIEVRVTSGVDKLLR